MRLVISIFAGIVAIYAMGQITSKVFGPARCRDGWDSPSIGRQGACSHHGGVNRSGENFAMLLMFGSGGLVGAMVYQSRLWGGERAPLPRPPVSKPPPPRLPDGQRHIVPHCRQCGSPMQLRVARRGRFAGKRFFGCTKYPMCTATIHFDR